MTDFEVTQGETFVFDYAALNVGDTDASQDIILNIDNSEEDRDSSVSVGKNGGRASGDLKWDTSGGTVSPPVSLGTFTATIESADDTATADIKVVAPGDFQVTITGSNEPVTEGNDLNVDVDIVNNGDSDDAQDITLTVDGEERDREAVFLNASGTQNDTKTVTLTWNTESGDARSSSYTATVESQDDTATTQVDVNEEVTQLTEDWRTPVSNLTEGVAYADGSVYALTLNSNTLGEAVELDATDVTVLD